MEKQIVEQIKKHITFGKDENEMKRLHKTLYVDGYLACCRDIERIIEMAEALKKGA